MDLRVPVEGGFLWAGDTLRAGDTGGDLALVLLHPGWGDSSIWLPVLLPLRAPDMIAELAVDLAGRVSHA